MAKKEIIQISKIILGVIAVAGVLSIALVAPGVFVAVKMFRKKNNGRFNVQIKQALKRLNQRGLIEINRGRVTLTNKGKQELAFYEMKKRLIKHPKKWDKKWRVVIFDVWERRRKVRDDMRKYLSQIGFVKLQQSVWVYPYECEDVVELFRVQYKLRSAVHYLVVEKIDDDDKFKKMFNLR
jgi:CRISPR-associated endonuclease Cas2